MPVIGCLEIFQNGRSPQPITDIIYSPGPLELNIGSAVEDTLGFIPLVLSPLIFESGGEKVVRVPARSLSQHGCERPSLERA